MIIALFGQPNCGKSTLANHLINQHMPYAVNIDGDKLRELFSNKDYSREGRIKNLNRASDIAVFINSLGANVILSLVYPYKEAREYLDSFNQDVIWIYLTYSEERGREANHVKDFEAPDQENVLHLNTTELSEEESLNKIVSYVGEKITRQVVPEQEG